jgi:CBS domain-containing protein
MKVHQILRSKGSEVASVAPDTPLDTAVQDLDARGVGALVVLDGDRRIVGILSERDVVRALSRRGMALAGVQVSDLMTTEVTTCRPDDDVDAVMAVMTRGRFRHVPVVESGGMVGVISIGDAVKARMQELEHEREALASYIASG